LGTLFYWRIEGWSVLGSFYFCVLTLATVSGGDLAPATLVGKVVTTLIALAGVGILLGFIYVVVKSTMNVPPNWEELRDLWHRLHLLRFVLSALETSALLLSLLADTRG
jgi:hypothetical protein